MKIAQDTLDRTPSIIASIAGASDSSDFVKEQLRPLDPSRCPSPGSSTRVHVVGTDTFTAARDIMRQDPAAQGKTAVLNLASDEARAGGWIVSCSRTQVRGSIILVGNIPLMYLMTLFLKEEALCYSSTLYATLKESYYPWPNLGPGSVAGVFSPDVVIFKDDLDHDCVDLPAEERRLVSVITVAAPRFPKLTPDGEQFAKQEDLGDLRGKIRLVYRMAATYGKTSIILGELFASLKYGCA